MISSFDDCGNDQNLVRYHCIIKKVAKFGFVTHILTWKQKCD